MKTVQHLLVICLAIFATSCVDDDFKPKAIDETSMTLTLECDMVNNASSAKAQFFNANGYTTELISGNTVAFNDQPMPFFANGSFYGVSFEKQTKFDGTFIVKGDNGKTYTNEVKINMTDPYLTESMIVPGKSATTVEWDIPLVADETITVYVIKFSDNAGANDVAETLITVSVDDDGATSLVIPKEETAKLQAETAYEVQCVRTLFSNNIDQAPSRGGYVITRLFMPRMNLDTVKEVK
ncbi:hypothetical protein OAT16_08490 [Prolixibacteraceae bacterium]|nr:hypothetical protein [Prolixibacteraceae bacterium]